MISHNPDISTEKVENYSDCRPPAEILRLHAGLRCIRLTGGLPDDPRRLFWLQPIDQFVRQSRPAAIRRLKRAVGDVRGEPDLQRLVLSIPAADAAGFAIDLEYFESGISCAFGPLCWSFDSDDGAWTWIERGLSAAYRLRIVTVAGREREWRLEPANDEPGDALATGHVGIFDLWRKRTSSFRQNDFRFEP